MSDDAHMSVTVCRKSGMSVDVEAVATACEYIVIHETLDGSTRTEAFTVAHLPTGAALGYFDTIDQAQRFAEVAGRMADWDFGRFGSITGATDEHVAAMKAARVAALEVHS